MAAAACGMCTQRARVCCGGRWGTSSLILLLPLSATRSSANVKLPLLSVSASAKARNGDTSAGGDVGGGSACSSNTSPDATCIAAARAHAADTSKGHQGSGTRERRETCGGCGHFSPQPRSGNTARAYLPHAFHKLVDRDDAVPACVACTKQHLDRAVAQAVPLPQLGPQLLYMRAGARPVKIRAGWERGRVHASA